MRTKLLQICFLIVFLDELELPIYFDQRFYQKNTREIQVIV